MQSQLGFLFTIIFYKGKSLLPCIIAHSFVNSSSVFAVENSSMKFHIISSAVLCIISLSYALWILKKTKQFDEYENNDRRWWFSFALSCTFIIRFRIWRNSAISISSAGLGGISFSRIRFCRKSFAFATIPRNRLGNQPLLLIDWLAFSCISVCLTSKKARFWIYHLLQ